MPNPAHTRLALLLPLAALPFAGLLRAAPAPIAKSETVEIRNFAFVPAAITVAPGTTVTWINRDEDPHSVVATDRSFRSAALDSDEKFAFTFTRPGDYAYFCALHPHMIAHVLVKSS